jgi:hypothetical protein
MDKKRHRKFSGLFGFYCLLIVGFTVSAGGATGIFDGMRDYTGQLAVFPDAQGFGMTTPAGRGGKIIRVTTLADDGPGSLREALTAKGPRTVIFEVGGVIPLKRHIEIEEPFLTVAGQTAPSPGITIINEGLRIRVHDVLVQHIRIRVGDSPLKVLPQKRSGLCIDPLPERNQEGFNVVIDHCSGSWGVDENFATWEPGVHDVTFRQCIIAEGLSNAGHPKGEHSKGLLIGDHSKRVAVIGNLFAHNTERNPYVKGDVSALIVNNLIYNPGAQAIHLCDYYRVGPYAAQIVGNVFIPGPNTPADLAMIRLNNPSPVESRVYLKDNLILDKGVAIQRSMLYAWYITRDPVMDLKPLTIHPAAEVKDWVLRTAGARPADRDAVDQSVVQDVKNLTGKIIDSPNQVGGYPQTPPVSRTLQLPTNPDCDDNHDGYTNLEHWLHDLAQELENPAN